MLSYQERLFGFYWKIFSQPNVTPKEFFWPLSQTYAVLDEGFGCVQKITDTKGASSQSNAPQCRLMIRQPTLIQQHYLALRYILLVQKKRKECQPIMSFLTRDTSEAQSKQLLEEDLISLAHIRFSLSQIKQNLACF